MHSIASKLYIKISYNKSRNSVIIKLLGLFIVSINELHIVLKLSLGVSKLELYIENDFSSFKFNKPDTSTLLFNNEVMF